MDPYTLKKILAPLLSPLPQALIWLAVGVLLLWFSRRQHLGKLLVTGSMTLLVITCSPPFAQWPILQAFGDAESQEKSDPIYNQLNLWDL